MEGEELGEDGFEGGVGFHNDFYAIEARVDICHAFLFLEWR